MPIVPKIKKGFLDATSECRQLFNHCLNPHGPISDAGIEATFLQMFRAWEFFLEESVVAYMCGRLACDGGSVSCHITAPSEEVARKILYQEKAYIEWTDVDKVRERLLLYFPSPNRIEAALVPNLVDLKHITRVRNAIAHNSIPARRNFDNLVQGLFGGRPRMSRPANLLAAKHPEDSAKTFFDRYADTLEFIATSITG